MGRCAGALVVAVAADVIQLPITLAFFATLVSGIGAPADLPLEGLDLAVDIVAAISTNWLLGFHWALLPTAVLEAIPGVSAAPTWTGCVLFVIWRRRGLVQKVTSAT
jgi:hypothetical protein